MKKIILFLIVLFPLLSLYSSEYVVDNASLLSNSEKETLSYALENVKEKTGISAVILSDTSSHGYTTRDWADLYIERDEYGKDGVVLFLNMGEREYYISTIGYAMYALGGNALSDRNLNGVLFPYLSSGDYYTAFSNWADYIVLSAEARPYDEYVSLNTQKEENEEKKFSPYAPLFYSLFLGFFLSYLFVQSRKRKLRNIGKVNNADDFVVPGSFKVNVLRDIFLYSNTNVVRIKSDNDRPSQSFHSSPSGMTHSGRGGKF